MSEGLESGSVEEVVRRLAVWAEGTRGGIALVRYDSEFARHVAADRLVGELDQRGISTVLQDLASVRPSDRIEVLVASLLEAPLYSVVLATGLVQAPLSDAEARERFSPWNFARERLAISNVAQVWWMPRPVAEALARIAPDLYSWLLFRVDLTEVLTLPTQSETPESIAFGDVLVARTTAMRLEERLLRTDLETRRGTTGLETVLRIVQVLETAGLYAEASGSLLRLSQAFGSRDIDSWIDEVSRSAPLRQAAYLASVADLDRKLGDFEAAKPRVTRAYQIFDSELGSRDIKTLGILSNLGYIFQEEGQFNQAQDIYRRVLAEAPTALGGDHPVVLSAMNNLATVLRRTGTFAEARALLEKVLLVRTSSLGKEHPLTLNSINNLANLSLEEGDLDTARELSESALRISQETLGENHPDTLCKINTRALIFQNEGLLSEAKARFDVVLAGRKRVLGLHHPETMSSISNLAQCLMEQGDSINAIDLLEDLVTSSKLTFGPSHPSTLSYRNLLERAQKETRSAIV